MIKSAVTISMVEQARGGPFVLWDDLAGSLRIASDLGYDAVELFLPGPDSISTQQIQSELQSHGLKLAAVGTGAGMVIHQLSLVDDDSTRRNAAIDFVKSMIRLGGELRAPAIIGSMQGRWTPTVGKQETLKRLADALQQLAVTASEFNVPLIYEPLNRYETNLCNTQRDGVVLLQTFGVENVVLLADLFHMNIEEQSIEQGIRDGGQHIGHLHFVDSNRRPAGCGHIDFRPIAQALRDVGYARYASAEAFAWPDSPTAAAKTMETFLQVFRPAGR